MGSVSFCKDTPFLYARDSISQSDKLSTSTSHSNKLSSSASEAGKIVPRNCPSYKGAKTLGD